MTGQYNRKPSVRSRLQYLRVLEKICEVFSSKRHFKMLQAFPVLEVGLKTMLQKIPLAGTPDE